MNVGIGIGQTIAALLSADRLGEALTEATAAVKARPQDNALRLVLAQLLVLAGDLERAETQAKIAQRTATEDAVGIGLFRQYLRGLHARSAWWRDGALPDFPGEPTLPDRHALALNIALRADDAAVARDALEALDAARGTCPAIWNGVATSDLRDLDDRLPHAFEAITSGGAYLWIDMARVASVSFTAPEHPLDLLCRPARIALKDGSSADLMILSVYPAPADDGLRLGRRTEFQTLPAGLSVAVGQRSYFDGQDMVGLLDAVSISFDDGASEND